MKPLPTTVLVRALILGAGVIALSVVLPSCGPVAGIAHIARARIDLDMAEKSQAEKVAVYEMVSANEYLQKAKEEYGYSDFIAADDYAVKADQFAKKARERADAASQLPPAQLPSK